MNGVSSSFVIDEADLLAYVDDQLGPARRAEVELYLLNSPEENLRIATDLTIQAGLKMLFQKEGHNFLAYPRGV